MGNSFTMPVATTADTASGHYADQADMEAKFGAINVQIWSNKDNDTADTDTIAVQRALDLADEKLNSFFRDGPYAVPLTPITDMIRDWAVVMAGYELYFARGMRDKKDTVGNLLKELLEAVKREMRQYRSGVLRLECTRRWSAPSAPTAC